MEAREDKQNKQSSWSPLSWHVHGYDHDSLGMQSTQLSTEMQVPACSEAPTSLLVQKRACNAAIMHTHNTVELIVIINNS